MKYIAGLLLFLNISVTVYSQTTSTEGGMLKGIDTTNIDMSNLRQKYEGIADDKIERYKSFEDTTTIQSGDLTGGVGDENTGNTQEKQEESSSIIEEGNEAKETSAKIIEAVASENKASLDSVPIWGFRYFRDSRTKLYSSAQDVKPPYNYILGVGDQLNIAIWGFADYNEVFTIEKDGYIQPRYVGRIYLKGLTLQNAIQVIKARYSRAYMIENSQFDVTLNYSRVISVNIVGEVEFPGSYTIPAVNTVFNLLSYIGGPTKLGSIRNIQIKRDGKVIRRFDLYHFLNNPTAQDDYFLQNNDYIFVPVSRKLVSIVGAIQRPFKYELLDNEKFDDLLRYAGGFKPNARRNFIQINRFIGNKAVLIDVNLDSLKAVGGKLNLYNGDVVIVKAIPEPAKNWVELTGAVKDTGKYELRPGERVSDLLRRAMGLADNAYKKEAYVFRLDPGTEGKTVIRVNLEQVLTEPGSEADIVLKDQDELKVFRNDYFIDKFTIEINGAVRNPSVIQAQKGLTFRDAILYAGGLLPSAYLERAFIKRTDRTTNSTYFVSVKLDTLNNYEKMDEIPIFQGDEIRILSNLSFVETKTLSISGAVKNSVIVDYWKGATLRDLVLMAGGMDERALIDKIVITRTKDDFQKELITVKVDTSNSYNHLQEYKLMPDDNVLVLSSQIFDISSKVIVDGMVNQPMTIDFSEGMTLSDALLLAGGFRTSAASNRIEVARISNFKDAMINSQPTEISIEMLEINRDFLNDPIANGYLLKPFDQIYIRRIPDFDFQNRVFVYGQVKYPGTYVLKKNEKLNSIIERTGGLTSEAFADGARLTRQQGHTGMVIVDLEKAMRRPGSKYNYILKNLDSIYIPKIENLVTVRGQIDYPFEESNMKRLILLPDSISPVQYLGATPEKKVNVPYTKGKRAKYYIKEYGSGFGKYAKRKDTYVILPNGHIKGTRFTIFGRRYPKVKEGSEIVVPRKPLKAKKRARSQDMQGFSKFTTIAQGVLSSITTTLTLYLLLKRSKE